MQISEFHANHLKNSAVSNPPFVVREYKDQFVFSILGLIFAVLEEKLLT